MRKVLLGLLMAVMCMGLAHAASSDTIAVKVTIIASLSVDITESELSLGSVNVGTTTASPTAITVTNNGSGVAETYSLSLTNPSGWTASQTAAGSEAYVLNAAFNSDDSVTWDNAAHALSVAPVVSTADKFAGDQTGAAVPHGAVRNLWFQFLSPTATGVTDEQSITVTVTAQAA